MFDLSSLPLTFKVSELVSFDGKWIKSRLVLNVTVQLPQHPRLPINEKGLGNRIGNLAVGFRCFYLVGLKEKNRPEINSERL